MVVRCHLDISKVSSQSSDKDHAREIIDEALRSGPILEQWDQLAHCIHPTYEKYSIELLSAIVTLWTTIRGHSFAQGWTMHFEKKCVKGVCKSLRNKD